MLRQQGKAGTTVLPTVKGQTPPNNKKKGGGLSKASVLLVAIVSAFLGAFLTLILTSNDASIHHQMALAKCVSASSSTSSSSTSETTLTESTAAVASTTTSTARITTSTSANDLPVLSEEGWKPVHVYYGDTNIVTDPIPEKWYLHDIPKNQNGNNWFGQHGQDVAVAKFFNLKRNGFFIDLAANDAIWASNTFALEHNLGWDGICIEPNPYYWYRLANRKCHAVGALVGGQNKEELTVRFEFSKVAGPYGGIVGSNYDNAKEKDDDERRYAASLLRVLQMFNAPSVIDYISLDVEGAEQYIMKDFPFESYTFKCMTIERPKDELRELLESNGYKHVHNFARGDTLWAHESTYEEGKKNLMVDVEDVDKHVVTNFPPSS